MIQQMRSPMEDARQTEDLRNGAVDRTAQQSDPTTPSLSSFGKARPRRTYENRNQLMFGALLTVWIAGAFARAFARSFTGGLPRIRARISGRWPFLMNDRLRGWSRIMLFCRTA